MLFALLCASGSPHAWGASLWDGCPSPASLPEALALIDQGYQAPPYTVEEVRAVVDPYIDEADCRVSSNDSLGEEETLCVGTYGVTTLEWESSTMCICDKDVFTSSRQWLADAPPTGDIPWTHLEVVYESRSASDWSSSTTHATEDLRWLGAPLPGWPETGTARHSFGWSTLASIGYSSSGEGMTLDDCSFSQSEAGWLGESLNYIQQVGVAGADWSGEIESRPSAGCEDRRTLWVGVWNGVTVGAVDEHGEADLLDVDLDGWPSDCGDCDDADPAVNPDAEDTPDDGVDQDCDGVDATSPAPPPAPPPRGCDDQGLPLWLLGALLPARRRA